MKKKMKMSNYKKKRQSSGIYMNTLEYRDSTKYFLMILYKNYHSMGKKTLTITCNLCIAS